MQYAQNWTAQPLAPSACAPLAAAPPRFCMRRVGTAGVSRPASSRGRRGTRAMQVQATSGWAERRGPPGGNRYLESPEVETGAGLAVPLSAVFAAGFSAAFSPLLSPLFSPALLSPLAGLPLLCA
jgi:hypothetical protein